MNPGRPFNDLREFSAKTDRVRLREVRRFLNHEAHEAHDEFLLPFVNFMIFVVQKTLGNSAWTRPRSSQRGAAGVGFFVVKLKETPPEMARLVLLSSSGLEIVRPMPT